MIISFYLPFSTALVFFADKGKRGLVCFFVVEHTLTPGLALFADKDTQELEGFFADKGYRGFVCFLIVEHPLTPGSVLSKDIGTREFKGFFAEQDIVTGFIFFSLEPKVIAWIVSGQNNGFCSQGETHEHYTFIKIIIIVRNNTLEQLPDKRA